MAEHIAPVIPISHALRARIRSRRPSRIAEPRPVEFGDLELPTMYPCKHWPCEEVVDRPGFCRGCRAEHAAARIVRGPYRRDVP